MRLAVPKGARPASEKVRQAIFSSIASRVPGARVLDLYCGSGAYGLEALSRGADKCVFVDNDPASIEATRANAKAAGFGARVKVRRSLVERYVRRQARTDGPFDLVFVDAPYEVPVAEALGGLDAALTDGSRVVVETRWATGDPTGSMGYVVEADRRYGDTRVLILCLGDQ